MKVLQRLQLDLAIQSRIDAGMGDAMRFALHVDLGSVSVSPATDHDQLAEISISLPHLKPDEAIGIIDQTGALAEGGDEFIRTRGRDP